MPMQVKSPTTIERAERAKLRAEEGAAAMSDYLADMQHTRMNTAKLRAERLAREAAPAPVADVPIKVKAKRKPRKLSS